MAEQFGVTQKVIADLIGISVRAFQQKRQANINQKSNKNVTERILKMRELMSVACMYFGDEQNARYWFNTPNIGLIGVAPILLCDTFLGMSRVENSIHKLLHGMTA